MAEFPIFDDLPDEPLSPEVLAHFERFRVLRRSVLERGGSSGKALAAAIVNGAARAVTVLTLSGKPALAVSLAVLLEAQYPKVKTWPWLDEEPDA